MEQFKSQETSKLILGLNHLYPENTFLRNLHGALTKFPNIINEDFLSYGQIESKRWLVKELENLSIELGLVYLTPGWYGLLAQLISESKLNFKLIRSFDIHKESVEISELINRNLLMNSWTFKATCLDILKINYHGHFYKTLKSDLEEVELWENPDSIINTACEHLDYRKWLELIPRGKIVILQNNDYFHCEGHINCVNSLEEFKANCGLSECLYAGVLELKKYNRFMLIGKK